MDKFVLARRLYDLGYSHQEVRSIWNYAYQEQTLPEAGKRKKKRWQAVALEEAGISALEVDLADRPGLKNNYF